MTLPLVSSLLSSFQNLVTIVYDISGLLINQSKSSSLISMGQTCNLGLFSLIYALFVVILTLVLLVHLKTIPFVIAAGCLWLVYLVFIFAGLCCYSTMKRVIKSLLRKANLRVSDKEVESNFLFDTSET